MIRIVVGLALVLATAIALRPEVGNCGHNIPLVEYVKVKGTQNLTFEQRGNYDFHIFKPFVLTGEQGVGIIVNEYPGYLEDFHVEAHFSDVNSDETPSLFPQIARTNQLIPSHFDYGLVGGQTLYNYSEEATATKHTFITYGFNVAPESDIQNWAYSFYLKSVDKKNGRPTKLWGQGTQFQRYKYGGLQDKIQHNGFVVETPCDLGLPKFCEANNAWVERADGTYIVESGLPENYPHPVDAVCQWAGSSAPAKKKKDLGLQGYQVVLSYANLGTFGSLQLTTPMAGQGLVGQNTAQRFDFGELPSIVYNTGNLEDAEATTFGFRARVVPVNIPTGSCFKVDEAYGAEEACVRGDIQACVTKPLPQCYTSWTVECAATADICESFVEAGLPDWWMSQSYLPAAKRSVEAESTEPAARVMRGDVKKNKK